ncbi:hypothetical protein V7S43_007648 [Phytophthora oleae]|uniref:Protein kinase domain-containing protein n=1 Tax=Phytophthora oleae TaxID=2107226 RepID=A0ABD3FLZ3_9STRA
MTTTLERVRLSQIIALVGYAVLSSFCLLLLVYLRVNRHVAFKGDAQATRKVLLPAFEPLLWILAVVTGGFTVFFCISLHVEMYTTSFPRVDSEFIYSGRQFVFVLALMFLCQKSVSVPALRRAVAKSVLLALYTVPVVWLLNHFFPKETTLFYFVRLLFRPTILIFVVYVCFVNPPAGRASQLTMRIHGAYIVVYHVLSAINTLIQNYAPDTNGYAATSYMVLSWGSCSPLFIWSLLRADTEYWRGMGVRVCIQSEDGQPSSYLDEVISSNQIHTLIEMHRDFLIDFAHLELQQKIGVGSSASVFSGQLRQRKPVAVKVYTPYRYTEEVVAEFSHEAALCASLRHPNIVKFFGMCVRPPTICLVSELCQGSLEDVLYTHTKTRRKHRVTRHVLELEGQVETVEVVDRQQMLLNIAYMLDCARAVTYVHSFTPPFLHRDIKPANFLVDNDNSVKLTDFGDSRRLPRGFPSKTQTNGKTDEPQTSIGTVTSSDSPMPTPGAPAPPQIKMTVTGTVNYMPPEMIGCRTGLATYGEAADVYSLAITFWDILYPDQEKYPATNPMLVFEGVLNGCRPPLEETDALPSKLRELIVNAWHNDPSMRPTMPQIVLALESIQEELLSVLAQELSEEIDRSGTGCHVTPIEKCFTGEFMVERMEDLDFIDSRGEGVRLGRALMDAGFLHHLRHERGFEDTNAMYFFDDSNINFCQPLAMLEEASGTSPETDDEPYPRPSQRRTPPAAKSKSSKRSRLFSHLTSTFSASGNNSGGDESSAGGKASGCTCRQRGRRELVPVPGYQKKHRVWLRSPPRAQSRSQRLESNSSSSCCSNSTGFSLSPKRWKRKKREENPLTHKLLDNVQDHTIDIVDEEVMESLSLVRPAA